MFYNFENKVLYCRPHVSGADLGALMVTSQKWKLWIELAKFKTTGQ